MKQKRKRLWALFLSAALIMTQLPAAAMAENNVPEDKVNFAAGEREDALEDGSIASFEELPSGVAEQTVPVGTELSGLRLPDTVMATVYHVTEDTVIPDKVNGGEADREGGLGREGDVEDESGDSSTASPSDADESISGNNAGDSSNMDSGETVTAVTTSEEEIPVTWDSEPAFDGDTAGTYVFTADVGRYTLADGAKLPQITVTVTKETKPCAKIGGGCTLEDGHEGECVLAPPANDALVKTITDWTFVDDENLNEGELALPGVSMDNPMDFDTLVSLLPTEISADVEGEDKPVILKIIGWDCPRYVQDENAHWPLDGEYTFTAKLEGEFKCNPLPSVLVALGGADTLDPNNSKTEGGLTVSASNDGEVSYAAGTGFSLDASGDYEISGTWSGSLNAYATVITVSPGITANVRLNTVDITVSMSAFKVADNSTANITLSGTNVLSSDGDFPGLWVAENATVTIDGGDMDSLTATGGSYGAGIGSGASGRAEAITINGGKVTATGGDGGTGIGSGYGSSVGTITINGGTVKGTGKVNPSDGTSGAGIGSGNSGSVETITINGGEVTATGSNGGAGIGSGYGTSSSVGTITISGGGVTAAGGTDSAGIGSGYGTSSSVKTITIGGGEVTATGGINGAGIGSGAKGNVEIITINDGTVIANGYNGGAGIGSGTKGNVEIITINDGTVIANGYNGGAGIGSGTGTGSSVKTITIGGGEVTATGDGGGAGIGGGVACLAGDITINGNAHVTAVGSSSGNVVSDFSIINNGKIQIGGSAVVNATGGNNSAGIGGGSGNSGAGIGGGTGASSNSEIAITGGTVTATGGINSAGIGGGNGIGDPSGNGGDILISGQDTKVTVTGEYTDIGNGTNGSNATLLVTGGATLEMKENGTNVNAPVYKNCTIIDKDGNKTKYGSTGVPIASPTLTLAVSPAGSVTLPDKVTLTATLSGAVPDVSGKEIKFTGGRTTVTITTDSSGKAVYTPANLASGTYKFGASFEGDLDNDPVSATEITGYTVNPRTQAALTLNGLGSAYTYGCEAFSLSTSGGSGIGAVSYTSSDSSVASVTGDTVTILKAGTFTITATKAGDLNYAEKSVTSGEVTASEATPNVNLSATGGSTTSDPITLTATVSKVGTGATPTGTVTFKENGGALETVTLNGSGAASHTVRSPSAGSHTYTAEYSGQTGYYKGASTTRTISVGLTNQTGFAITDPGAKTYGDNDFTLAATGGQSGGSVSFSAPQNNGVLAVEASGNVKIIGAGTVTVTANKDGDGTYNQATATREITVAPRNIAHVTVNVTGDRVYTGSQLQPVFEVKDGTLAITTGDYTNSYGPNVDAGTGAGSITLTGQRNYTGTKPVNFDIDKRSLNGAVITLEAGPFKQTGSAIEPAVTGVVVGSITVPAAAYDVSYQNNINAGDATVTITAKADGNFSDKASITFTIQESDKTSDIGSSSNSGGSSYSEPEPQSSYTVAGDSISRTVSRSDLRKLADSGKSLTLRCDKAGMIFGPAALTAILAAVPATAGNITFAAAPANLGAFPDAAKQIGAHPVYDFTISYKDSKGNLVTVPVNFPAGSAAITLNYTPAAAEVTGSLFMVYVDGKGAVTWLDKSSYKVNGGEADREGGLGRDDGWMLADVLHFSTYGVAYKTPAPVFTDITGHWAKEDIEFVAARGLLSGKVNDAAGGRETPLGDTGNNQFSPDGTMTRGMFVTALGRLAGVNPDSYKTRSFTDVKADAYYAAYVEWAAQKNIAGGTGDKLFSPDAPVTREQMAVMMVNYAGQMGYSIPTPLAAVTFADSDQISAWAAKEVAAMQRAGIVKGKDGNRFDPQGNATRAEGSAVLRRFVEIVIDPATATGWIKNDSGHWLYYKGGTALTGWREIDGKWYYFDENGVMAVNTKVDGYEVGPDGTRKEN